MRLNYAVRRRVQGLPEKRSGYGAASAAPSRLSSEVQALLQGARFIQQGLTAQAPDRNDKGSAK